MNKTELMREKGGTAKIKTEICNKDGNQHKNML